MASLTAIRAAVKETLVSSIDGLMVYDTAPGGVVGPAVVVVPVEADFVVAFGRGADTIELDLIVFAPASDLAVGQATLDELVTGAGPRSIRQAVFNNRTLGLAGVDAHVARMSDYGMSDPGLVDALAARLRLIVHTTGTR